MIILKEGSGNIHMNSTEKNSSKIVLKNENFYSNCQLITKIEDSTGLMKTEEICYKVFQ